MRFGAPVGRRAPFECYLGYYQVSTLSVRNALGFEIHPMFQFYLYIGESRGATPRLAHHDRHWG